MNEIVKCFICKKEVTSTTSLSETAFLRLPNGARGYVHTHHVGVLEETERQGQSEDSNLDEAIKNLK